MHLFYRTIQDFIHVTHKESQIEDTVHTSEGLESKEKKQRELPLILLHWSCNWYKNGRQEMGVNNAGQGKGPISYVTAELPELPFCFLQPPKSKDFLQHPASHWHPALLLSSLDWHGERGGDNSKGTIAGRDVPSCHGLSPYFHINCHHKRQLPP